ncbi:hypothetical protein LJC32_02610 [Oscillospiraceae bacterium OttesenSCG-928-F05]|nr:hypothetical protein [Oscillospiraceae bacterium OttesenSCG-928-F05]
MGFIKRPAAFLLVAATLLSLCGCSAVVNTMLGGDAAPVESALPSPSVSASDVTQRPSQKPSPSPAPSDEPGLSDEALAAVAEKTAVNRLLTTYVQGGVVHYSFEDEVPYNGIYFAVYYNIIHAPEKIQNATVNGVPCKVIDEGPVLATLREYLNFTSSQRLESSGYFQYDKANKRFYWDASVDFPPIYSFATTVDLVGMPGDDQLLANYEVWCLKDYAEAPDAYMQPFDMWTDAMVENAQYVTDGTATVLREGTGEDARFKLHFFNMWTGNDGPIDDGPTLEDFDAQFAYIRALMAGAETAATPEDALSLWKSASNAWDTEIRDLLDTFWMMLAEDYAQDIEDEHTAWSADNVRIARAVGGDPDGTVEEQLTFYSHITLLKDIQVYDLVAKYLDYTTAY